MSIHEVDIDKELWEDKGMKTIIKIPLFEKFTMLKEKNWVQTAS